MMELNGLLKSTELGNSKEDTLACRPWASRQDFFHTSFQDIGKGSIDLLAPLPTLLKGET